mgnify:CR=1 FL=1
MKIDKRTKAYKDSIKNKAPLGLGDVVEKITTATGIKKIVEVFTPEGKDCGCDKRKKDLNLNFELGIGRYKVLRCMTEIQYNAYKEFQDTRTLSVTREQIQLLVDLFAHVFAIQYNVKDFCTNCSGSAKRVISMQERLDKVFKSYKK